MRELPQNAIGSGGIVFRNIAARVFQAIERDLAPNDFHGPLRLRARPLKLALCAP